MKSKIFTILFLLIILITNISFASYSTVSMQVVEEPVSSIELSENSKFEKRLVSKDLINKEVTIQLQVTNDELRDGITGEIVFVVDNSDSMLEKISDGRSRKDVVFDSSKSIISNLLKDNNNLKIGVVSFSTNIDQSLEGTASDATVVSPLSNDATALNNAISGIIANGPRTNLESGLSLGSTLFSNNANNKYLIVLTDGVPNVAINYDHEYYSNDVINKTIQQLENIKRQGIHITTMLTKVDETFDPGVSTNKTFGDIIDEIFGTMQNPKYGSFYYIPDDKIEKTIKEDIYNSLIPQSKTLTNITIVDYFPEEIVKNFDFAYVSKANIGNISATIDSTNNSITWTIPELKPGQTATVQYKLKLKENFDSKIVDKLLRTNEKVDVKYTDFDGNQQSKTSTISPTLKLSEPPSVLPQTGTITLIGFGILAITLVVLSTIKLIDIYKKTN